MNRYIAWWVVLTVSGVLISAWLHPMAAERWYFERRPSPILVDFVVWATRPVSIEPTRILATAWIRHVYTDAAPLDNFYQDLWLPTYRWCAVVYHLVVTTLVVASFRQVARLDRAPNKPVEATR